MSISSDRASVLSSLASTLLTIKTSKEDKEGAKEVTVFLLEGLRESTSYKKTVLWVPTEISTNSVNKVFQSFIDAKGLEDETLPLLGKSEATLNVSDKIIMYHATRNLGQLDKKAGLTNYAVWIASHPEITLPEEKAFLTRNILYLMALEIENKSGKESVSDPNRQAKNEACSNIPASEFQTKENIGMENASFIQLQIDALVRLQEVAQGISDEEYREYQKEKAAANGISPEGYTLLRKVTKKDATVTEPATV